MASLVVEVVFRGRVLETVPFSAPALRIGRMPENDVVLDNLGVSRFHARLLLEDGRVVLEDAGSENGCFVNGERVDERRAIALGESIQIGKHELRVREAEAGVVPERRHARRKGDAWDGARTYLFDSTASVSPSKSEPKEPVVMAPIESKQSEPVPVAVETAGGDAHEIDFDFVGSLNDEPGDQGPKRGDTKPPPPLHAGFIVQRQGKLERVVAWNADVLVGGRSGDCDVVLGQDEVSRHHVRFERTGDEYVAIDLGSVNGTFVNGRRIDRQTLAVGDVITVEGFQLTFVLDRDPLDGAVAAKPVARPTPQEDRYAMTMLQEEMPQRGDLPESAPKPAPLVAAAEPLAEADLLPDDIEELSAIEEDAEKPADGAPLRGSSRASSVQDLGRTSQPNLTSAEVRFELRVRVDLLPPALRKAFADAGASEIVLPAELRLKSS